MWNEELQDAKGQASLNELKQKAVELGKKGKDVSGKVVEKDTIGLMSDACDVVIKGGGGIAGKVAKGGETACVIGGSIAKSVETYQVIQELDAASKQNQDRQAKLIQQLEARVSTVSQKISQLRRDVDVVDWSTMGKPEPNMTPIKQKECDDALDRLVKDGLSEMDHVKQAAPVREPSQSDSKIDGLAILGEVLGNVTTLQQQFRRQQEMYKSHSVVPVPQDHEGCEDRERRQGRSGLACDTRTPTNPMGTGGNSPSGQPNQGRSSSGRDCGPEGCYCNGKCGLK